MREKSGRGFIALVFICLTALAMPAAMAEPIRVMSWNIRLDTAADGINAWPHRKDAVAQIMGSRYQGDIIGLQEVLRHQLDDLVLRLPGYSWVGVGRDDGRDRGEFSPILYRSDRFRLLATNTFWLSETPQLPGSRSWDAAITRVLTWARFEDLISGERLTVFNTHFDHRGEQARINSAQLVLDQIPAIAADLPYVLTGDLNVPETAEAYAVLAASVALNDARYLSESGHQGPTASFNNWEQLREDESRIDYIFVSPSLRVLTHRMLDDRYQGRFPSDHLPVLADILVGSD
jgi:endonuclease/exonuclease/phosphatase family metal-dependent hydrolase